MPNLPILNTFTNTVIFQKLKQPDFSVLYKNQVRQLQLRDNPYLTLKVPITTAANDIHKHFFNCFSEKIRLDVSSESSARRRIHLKNQALFSSKDKNKKLKCLLLQFLFGALRVKSDLDLEYLCSNFCPIIKGRYGSSCNDLSLSFQYT